MVQTVRAKRVLQSVKSAESRSASGKSAAPGVAEKNDCAVAKVKSTRPRGEGTESGPLSPAWPFANPTPPTAGRPRIPQPPPVRRGDESMQMLVYAFLVVIAFIGGALLWAWLR